MNLFSKVLIVFFIFTATTFASRLELNPVRTFFNKDITDANGVPKLNFIFSFFDEGAKEIAEGQREGNSEHVYEGMETSAENYGDEGLKEQAEGGREGNQEHINEGLETSAENSGDEGLKEQAEGSREGNAEHVYEGMETSGEQNGNEGMKEQAEAGRESNRFTSN